MSLHGNLIVGVGSTHGDDQAGWRLIDVLEDMDDVQDVFTNAAFPDR